MVDSTKNLLPRFNELLAEAAHASERADMFDVYSEQPESLAKWKKLLREASNAKANLLLYIKDNPTLLEQILSSTR
jgi:hypothetical protein